MRVLIILRGLPGSGKSTWVKSNSLENYTLSSDNLRLLLQSPSLDLNGKLGVSQKNETKVWKMFAEFLGQRMERGEFVVVDATHTKTADFQKYKKLAEDYKYRTFCIDFSFVGLEDCLNRNLSRAVVNQVPESVLERMQGNLQTQKPPSWVEIFEPRAWEREFLPLKKELQPDKEFWDLIRIKPLNLQKYTKIHHLGDLQGCLSPLLEYILEEKKEVKNTLQIDLKQKNGEKKIVEKEGAATENEKKNAEKTMEKSLEYFEGKIAQAVQKIKEKENQELFIFVGDYCDRGVENAPVLTFLLEIYQFSNVILLEGNHEIYLWQWATGQKAASLEFENQTKSELETAKISTKDVRQLYRKLRQMCYYEWNGKQVLVTHGGLSTLPENLVLIATNELIKGVGNYGEIAKVSESFNQSAGKNCYQVHGHRNVGDLPIENGRSFNLEGKVEFGGSLRAVVLDKSGFKPVEIANWRANQNAGAERETETDGINLNYINLLRQNEGILEKNYQQNISSFNFKTKVFYEGNWDEQTIKARGLFINTKTGEIVIRSFDKFFNFGEKPQTELKNLRQNLQFPVQVWVKENGFLGLIGYNSQFDSLTFASKSSTSSTFAAILEKLVRERFGDKLEQIKAFLAAQNCSLVLEVIEPDLDPHIIEYSRPRLILLEAVKRQIEFEKVAPEILEAFWQKLNLNESQLERKVLARTLHSFEELEAFLAETSSFDYQWQEQYLEGFVLEDAKNFHFKLKLGYYAFWKNMRTQIAYLLQKKPVNYKNILTEQLNLAKEFLAWAATQEESDLNKGIIFLRRKFSKK